MILLLALVTNAAHASLEANPQFEAPSRRKVALPLGASLRIETSVR